MKLTSASAVLALLGSAGGRFIEPLEQDGNQFGLYTGWAEAESDDAAAANAEKFLIELGPGETRWVTEEQKWELRRNGQRFFDITNHGDLASLSARPVKKTPIVFPTKPKMQKQVKPLLANLSKSEMEANLKKLTSFHTRYYKSDYGRQSSEWLLSQINLIISEAGADKTLGVTAEPFTHKAFPQKSIIVTIPGKTNNTVVVGAHQDSINLWLPSVLGAPGADDDGSGTVTILEALRTLLSSSALKQPQNTLEFHWYAAEEGGLLGSQDIFRAYANDGRIVKAMLQQDMTGFVTRTLQAGRVESVGVVTDHVSPELTDFIKTVIVTYCDIPFVETQCGYACSDHASASKAGYPSAFVIESAFEYSDNHIHSTDDLIEYLSFDHMLQHAKLTTAFAYELAFADFAVLEGSLAGEL